MTAAELRKQRQKLHEDNTALLQRVQKRWSDDTEKKKSFIFAEVATTEEREEWDKRDADFELLDAEIARLEQHEARAKQIAEDGKRSAGTVAGKQDSDETDGATGPALSKEEKAERQTRAVDAFLRFGYNKLSPEYRQYIGTPEVQRNDPYLRALVRDGIVEERALTSLTAGSGGNTVPDAEMASMVEARALWGGMRRSRATILRTSDGRQIPIPTDDDTGNSGSIVAENVEIDELDVTFGQKLLDAWIYTSKIVRVPFSLLEDSSVNIEEYLGRKFGRRIGKAENAHFTTGSGSSQPNGVVTAGTSGKTAASATALTYLELLDLKDSVDPEYRLNAEWMFRDSTRGAIKQLLDGDSRPLFQPDVQSGRITRIDGDPFVINQDVAAIAASAKSVLYGDFSNYWIRDVRSVRILRLEERFAEFGQVGFVALVRTDGELMDAGTNPIKFLTQAA